MWLPPELTYVEATLVGSAATTVLAAPGAGYRYRVWAWVATSSVAAVGDGTMWIGHGAGVSTLRGRTGLSDETRSRYQVIPGGIPWTENQALRANGAWSGAAPDVIVGFYYTTEQV